MPYAEEPKRSRHKWYSLEPNKRFMSVCVHCGMKRKLEPKTTGPKGWRGTYTTTKGEISYMRAPACVDRRGHD